MAVDLHEQQPEEEEKEALIFVSFENHSAVLFWQEGEVNW